MCMMITTEATMPSSRDIQNTISQYNIYLANTMYHQINLIYIFGCNMLFFRIYIYSVFAQQ